MGDAFCGAPRQPGAGPGQLWLHRRRLHRRRRGACWHLRTVKSQMNAACSVCRRVETRIAVWVGQQDERCCSNGGVRRQAVPLCYHCVMHHEVAESPLIRTFRCTLADFISNARDVSTECIFNTVVGNRHSCKVHGHSSFIPTPSCIVSTCRRTALDAQDTWTPFQKA